MSARCVPTRRLWWLVAGFGVWCSALVSLYAVHAIGCTFAWPGGALRLALGLVLLAHLIVLGWMWRDQRAAARLSDRGPTGVFLQTVVVWTLIAALIATLLTLGPTLALTTCV